MDNDPQTSTIIFAGGGTAGHILPAIAIAEELAEHDKHIHTHFICSTRSIDARVLASHAHTPLPAKPFSLHPLRAPGTLLNLINCTHMARSLLQQLNAGVVVTTGGFTCPPVACAARLLKVPLIMLNLDAVPGKANRLISRMASLNLTAADTHSAPKSWQRITPIVRRSLDTSISPQDQATARIALSLDAHRETLLITGGSQGARSINALMLHVLRAQAGTTDAALSQALLDRNYQVFHQAGPSSSSSDDLIEELERAYADRGIPARVVEFEQNMQSAYAAATIALTRAGAGTVAELWNSKTPALLLPYPYHTDNHQAHNAAPLVNAGSALLEQDLIDPARNALNAGARLSELISDPQARATLEVAAQAMAPPTGRVDAANAIHSAMKVPTKARIH